MIRFPLANDSRPRRLDAALPMRCSRPAVLVLLLTSLLTGFAGCRVEYEAWIPTPEGPVWGTYEIWNGRALVDGDQTFKLDYLEAYQEEAEAYFAGQQYERSIFNPCCFLGWEKHDWEIPYVVDPGIPDNYRQSVLESALEEWNTRTLVRWVPLAEASQQEDYVRFIHVDGACRADLGRQRGEQDVMIDTDPAGGFCGEGDVVHEMGHSLGFIHEHQREDRDDYVEVFLENVEPNESDNFDVKTVGEWGEYDYGSIMHYDRDNFSIDGGDTMVPKQRLGSLEEPVPADLIGTRIGLSKGDISAVNSRVADTFRLTNDDAAYNGRSILAIENGVSGAREHLTGDFNGDGLTDLAYIRGDDNDIWVALAREDGTLAPATSWHPSLCGAEICVVGDVQGDGIDDIIFVTTEGYARIARSDGQGSFRATVYSNWLSVAFTDFDHVAVEDVNGDCEVDLVGFRQLVSDQGNPYTQVYFFSNSFTGYRTATFMGKYHAGSDQEVGWGHLADVNKDERPDIVMVTTSGDVYVALNDGVIDGVYPRFGGRSPVFELWSRGTCTDAESCRIHDMDGDGRADVVMMDPDADHYLDRVRIALSTGFAFRDDVANFHELDCRRDIPCLLGDVNGDGLGDLVDPIGLLDDTSNRYDRRAGDVFVSLGTGRYPGKRYDSFWTEDIGPRNQVPGSTLDGGCVDLGIDLGF